MDNYANLNKLYESTANSYLHAFCDMMQRQGNLITDAGWVGGVVGGIMQFSDTYTLSYDDLRYVVHNKVTYKQVTRWIDHCNEMHEYGLMPPSLEDWHHGRSTISMDKLERIRELKKQFDECVASVREQY